MKNYPKKDKIQKLFSLEEANYLVKDLEILVKKILVLSVQIKEEIEIKGKKEYDADIQKKIQELETLISQIDKLGCYYRDWSFTLGLVDLPTIIDNKLAYFCWKYGEKEIGYFHFANEGFSQRKKLGEIKSSQFN